MIECVACARTLMFEELVTPHLAVSRCPACGHRTARHAAEAPLCDYHEQYEQGAFVEALRATRLRQARKILSRIRAAAPAANKLLDFGCGRGWFLEAAQAAGWQVEGVDPSARAVEMLAGRGIPAVLLQSGDRGLPAAARLVSPQVVTLLDVLEHFPSAELLDRMKRLLLAAAPKLQLLVVKVPISSGFLYRAASAMRRAGSPRSFERLYQVGTSPPHWQYFSRRSLRALLGRLGLAIVELRSDLDFEPRTLRDRAGLSLPRPLVVAAGMAAAAAAWTLRMQDSVICIARPHLAPTTADQRARLAG